MNNEAEIKRIKKRIATVEGYLTGHRVLMDLKKKGDIHINNVFRFFNIWVDKDHELRDAVKKIVFGVIYGKGARTLAKDINDAVEKAQQIMDKMFKEFKVGSEYLDSVSLQATNNGVVMSPLGRRRNLYRVFTGIRSFVASAQRRAKNAPIQGMASEIGMQTAYLILKECDKYLTEQGLNDTQWPLFTRTVHDANYFEVPYDFVVPFIHIMQYMSTFGVTKHLEETFDWKFTIEPEIEVELSTREDKSYKWNWSMMNLRSHIESSLKDQIEMGFLDKKEFKTVLERILAPWNDDTTRAHLQSNYPLLGVKKLRAQILEAANMESTS